MTVYKVENATNLEYFAATQDLDVLANNMLEKIRVWREFCSRRGLIGLWQKKLSNYYGHAISGNSSQAVSRGGSEGELALIKVNDLHSLVQEQLVIVTSQRPAGMARAINSDTDSLKSARIGTALAEYYMSEGNFEGSFTQAAEAALLCDEAYIELIWDKTAGDPVAVDPQTNMPEMSGDAVLRVHCPWNSARDPGIKTPDNKWYIFSFAINKFDAAATFDRFHDEIIAAGEDDLPSIPMNKVFEGSDAVYAHVLIHDRTAVLPNGRYSLLINNTVVLDTELPYKDFPVERIAPTDVIDSCLGYAPANDILALEEVTDALHSIVTTNQVTFGGQCLIAAEGMNLKTSDLAKGVRLFEVDPAMFDKLKPLDLVRTAPEIFNYIQMLGEKKGKAVGSVSQVLSQQAAQGASGSSMALIQTQSISYNSGIQKSYFRLLSGTMTKLISVLATYADTPRVVNIVGKSKAQGLKAFQYTGKTLAGVSSIVYEVMNPMAQTQGGRLTAAQDLLKAGQIKSPKEYINLWATGQMDALTQDDEADGLTILEENENLSDGLPVQAVITEIHMDHIKSHNSILTPEVKRNNPDLVERVLNHVQQHIDIWQQASMTNPGILIATGQQPLPPPPPPPGMGMIPPPPGGPGGPPPPLPPQAPPGKSMAMIAGSGRPPVENKADEVKQPQLPTIAGTHGEKPVVPGVTQ